MSIFEIELRKRGVDVQSVREAFRQAIEDVRSGAADPFYLHNVGQFKPFLRATRFTVFEEHVYKSGGDQVVKMYPPHVPSTELAESIDVQCECSFGQDSSAKDWLWKSTSRATNFVAQQPSEFVGQEYKLHRINGSKRSTYVLAESAMSAADAANVGRVDIDSGNLKIKAVHFDNSLLSFLEGDKPPTEGRPGEPKWSAQVGGGGPLVDITTAGVTGQEARAWVMQRAI